MADDKLKTSPESPGQDRSGDKASYDEHAETILSYMKSRRPKRTSAKCGDVGSSNPVGY